MAEPLRVAVLISGSGTNLQALLDRFHSGADPSAEVVRVIASKAGIAGLERAEAAGVPGVVLGRPRTSDDEVELDGPSSLLDELRDARAELVVLAGYLKLVPSEVVRSYLGRMINIHPALLPSFGGPGMYGRRVHAAVLKAGARVSGATVHFVDEEYDRGPIIAQWPVPVFEQDTPEVLAARVLETEHRLLPEVVSAFARGEVSLDSDRRVRWTRPFFAAEQFRTADTAGADGSRDVHQID